ncbi:alkaline phosphatase-like isoform X1 [Centruroides sculpturatus]|uniref:alkaline phosphatase-like isoform X1 n=2 Tax=Centruroides sculpturatus TaxID=218467 RepID=UPI000C6E041B|nr:alkaline phosphatase-like isoform X1 [Centruroides sculpturatus]
MEKPRGICCVIILLCFTFVFSDILDEQNARHWNEIGDAELKSALNLRMNTNVAKNVILFLGDGMGISTITSSRIYKGQKDNKPGEESKLSFDKFPYVSLIKTYSVSKQVPDSAATATAFLTGVKTRNGMIGLTAKAKVGVCKSSKGNEISSIMEWSQNEGKDTGLVTTTRVTHATPAALYAHTVHRDWECDDDVPADSTGCLDIARQLVEEIPGKNAKVIFGGGRRKFLPKTVTDYQSNQTGQRKDGRNLIEVWKMDKKNRNNKYTYVTNLKQFNEIDVANADYALGLFNYDHMQYELERNTGEDGEPSLADMTEKAIDILKKSQKGFFLLVEGGRIDHGHHVSSAIKALEDTVAFSLAISRALNKVNLDETLIVVTADHSHVLTINGYPNRGNPILGIADVSDMDNKSYTTLMYTNGPGFNLINGERPDAKDENTTSPNYIQYSGVPLKSETHGGEDVALFAIGPMAHLFHGVHEQVYIARVMGYASCVGSNKDHCSSSSTYQSSSSSTCTPSKFILCIILIYIFKNFG